MPERSDRRRLLDKLLRELVRSENQAREHAPCEARRIGEAPPVAALREIALHAVMMGPRLTSVLEAHDVGATAPAATFSRLRTLVPDRLYDAERAYLAALLDLRHGLDVVRVLREVARLEELFGLIRWCDDWLAARRTLVARVEAQLAWFGEQPVPPATADPCDPTP